ncbi:tRNA (adenine(22)-N(1))-methyltransferase TrmK [Limosilactobacillus pontis]|uniref:tRNA (Adenine(22)-N(1))-methyltransferase TrmK n=1 Tax=Limosilactobacillus pontis TaxID=35787 RepID=A0ABT7UY11_9LACO|nr:tRNA (adenine(22)-N(1))-methyltransferase TrmK [Limosilactobacillus pontis]MDM8266596.1 tRNA (adenine(22)-N(1))-methyltransferase TrmK [Limosilactobacillus pontis]
MDEKNLSKRLATVASYVPAGARMADIGSDHAYLPAALALQKKISYAVAGEVVKGPYENAVSEIKGHGLTDLIKPRLADGLAAITPADRIDTVVAAGMGGTLIAEILERGKDRLQGVRRLVLQPNVGEGRLRRWLMDNRYQIMAEQIVAEDDHIYEIIVAEPSVVSFRYSDYELMFGPRLLEKKGPVFTAKWRDYIKRQQGVIHQMEQAQKVPVARIAELKQKLALVAEAIDDD